VPSGKYTLQGAIPVTGFPSGNYEVKLGFGAAQGAAPLNYANLIMVGFPTDNRSVAKLELYLNGALVGTSPDFPMAPTPNQVSYTIDVLVENGMVYATAECSGAGYYFGRNNMFIAVAWDATTAAGPFLCVGTGSLPGLSASFYTFWHNSADTLYDCWSARYRMKPGVDNTCYPENLVPGAEFIKHVLVEISGVTCYTDVNGSCLGLQPSDINGYYDCIWPHSLFQEHPGNLYSPGVGFTKYYDLSGRRARTTVTFSCFGPSSEANVQLLYAKQTTSAPGGFGLDGEEMRFRLVAPSGLNMCSSFGRTEMTKYFVSPQLTSPAPPTPPAPWVSISHLNWANAQCFVTGYANP
jgi:hypothetical protein